MAVCFPKKDSYIPDCLTNTTSSNGIHCFQVVRENARVVTNLKQSIYVDTNVHIVVHTYNKETPNDKHKDIYVIKGLSCDKKSADKAKKYAKKIYKEKQCKDYRRSLEIFFMNNQPQQFTYVLKLYNETAEADKKENDQPMSQKEENINHNKNPDSVFIKSKSSSSSSSSSVDNVSSKVKEVTENKGEPVMEYHYQKQIFIPAASIVVKVKEGDSQTFSTNIRSFSIENNFYSEDNSNRNHIEKKKSEENEPGVSVQRSSLIAVEKDIDFEENDTDSISEDGSEDDISFSSISDTEEKVSLEQLGDFKSNTDLAAWIVNKEKTVIKDKSTLGDLYSKEVYLYINVNEVSNEKYYQVFIWNGMNSSKSDLKLALKFLIEIIKHIGKISLVSKEAYYHHSDSFNKLKNLFYIHHNQKSTSTNMNENQNLVLVSMDENCILAREKSFNRNYLNDDECYIIEDGNNIFQLHGKNSEERGKYFTEMVAQHIKNSKEKSVIKIISESNHQEKMEILNKLPSHKTNLKHDIIFAPILKKIIIISLDKKLKEKIRSFDSYECYLINLTNVHFLWIGNSASESIIEKGLERFIKLFKKDANKHAFGQVVFQDFHTPELEFCLKSGLIQS